MSGWDGVSPSAPWLAPFCSHLASLLAPSGPLSCPHPSFPHLAPVWSPIWAHPRSPSGHNLTPPTGTPSGTTYFLSGSTSPDHPIWLQSGPMPHPHLAPCLTLSPFWPPPPIFPHHDLCLALIWPNPAEPPSGWDESTVSMDVYFNVHFNLTLCGFNLTLLALLHAKIIFCLTWTNSQNHQVNPFPSKRYLYESPSVISLQWKVCPSL